VRAILAADQWDSAITKLDFRELMRIKLEMNACSWVDMDFTADSRSWERDNMYTLLAGRLCHEIAERELNFIGHHGMYSQFLAEDQAGQR
jgi:hypothetical protein